MAIKLDIPQTAQSNVNYVNSANSLTPRQQFGNQVEKPGKVPTEDSGSIFNGMMNSAQRTGQSWSEAADTVGKIGAAFEAFSRAEDEKNGQSIINQLQVKHSEISAANNLRISNGEITLKQLADENKKMFEEESRNMIENQAWNDNSIKDTMYQKSSLLATTNYESDIKHFVQQNTKELISGFDSEIDQLATMAVSNPAQYQAAVNRLTEMGTTDRRVYLYGTDNFKYKTQMALQKAGATLIDNAIKADPFKAKENYDNGVYEQVLAHIPESYRGVIEADINSKIIETTNKARAEENYKSTQEYERIQYETSLGNRPSIISIQNNSLLDDGKKATLINSFMADQKDLMEIDQSRQMHDGSGIGLSESQRKKDYTIKYLSQVNEIKKNPELLKPLLTTMESDYGPKNIPDEFFAAIGKPVAGSEKAHSNFIIDINVNHPEYVGKLPSNAVDLAYIMNEEKPTGGQYTYGEALTIHQERKQKAILDENNKDDISKFLPKDALYKDPASAIRSQYGLGKGRSTFWSDDTKINDKVVVPAEAMNDFQKQYRIEQRMHPNANEQELTSLATKNMNWIVSNIGDKEFIVKRENAPESHYTDPIELKSFRDNVVKYTEEKGIKNFNVLPNPNGKGFFMRDVDKGMLIMEDGKLKTFTNNPLDALPDQTQRFAGIKVRLSQNQVQLRNTLTEVEKQFPELSKYPGVLFAITGPETSGGTNKNKSSTGAQGIGQFTKGNAKKYGITENSPLSEQGRAMGDLLSTMIKQNGGDIVKALKMYSGYYDMAKPKGTLIYKAKAAGEKDLYSVGPEQALANFHRYLKNMEAYGFNLPPEQLAQK